MVELPPITLRLRGRKVVGRVAFILLLLGSIALGAAAGLLFVYSSDLPEIRALEDYQPEVVTELYADDGQMIGNFALQRRILLTYEQFPQVLKDAITDHRGSALLRALGRGSATRGRSGLADALRRRIQEGASTLTMQLAGGSFSIARTAASGKTQEALLAIQIERHYTKQQIFTMYANQVYLAHGNYGFEAASEYYFGKQVGQLTPPGSRHAGGLDSRSGLLADSAPEGARERRNLVIELMARDSKITTRDRNAKRNAQPLGLNVSVTAQ